MILVALTACGRSQIFSLKLPDGGHIGSGVGGGGHTGVGGGGGGGSSGVGGGGSSGVGGGGGPATCTPANCSDGCCQGTTCVRFPQQSKSTCGLYAMACKACQPSGRCELGLCRSNPCNATTCDGCCNTDICNPGVLAGSCGSNFCTPCATGTACINKMCTTVGVRVGDGCTSDTQCAALGTGGYCKKTTTSGSGTYTGGFCTLPCYGANSCPGGAGPNGGGTQCLQVAAAYGEADVFCSPECQPSAPPCRAGYACNQMANGQPVCWLNPLPKIGPNTAIVGSTCSSNTECSGLPGGFCIQDVSPTFGNTGYRNGYCTANCSASVPCPTGTLCVTETFASPVGNLTASTCKTPCSGMGLSTCRIGYTCEPSSAGGWCGPNCINGGIPCPPGKFCNPSSGYCL